MAHRPRPDFISEWRDRGRTVLQTRIGIAEWEAEHLPEDQRLSHIQKTIDDINSAEARIQEMQRRDNKAAKTVSTITSIATAWAGIPLINKLKPTGENGVATILPFRPSEHQFFGGGDSGEPASVSNTSWINDAINIYVADRAAKRAASNESAEREFRERQSLAQMDFTLARERQAMFGGQGGNNFNPFPGDFSFNPRSDNADNKRRIPSNAQDWMLPLVLIGGAVALIAAFRK